MLPGSGDGLSGRAGRSLSMCRHTCAVLGNSAKLSGGSWECLMENSCFGFVFFRLDEGSSVITFVSRCQPTRRGSAGLLPNVSVPACLCAGTGTCMGRAPARKPTVNAERCFTAATPGARSRSVDGGRQGLA